MSVKFPKKVLHIVGQSSYDGTCIYAVRLAEAASHYEHFFLFVQKGSADAELVNIKKKYLTDSKTTINILSYLSVVLSFFLSNNYDVIHYHSGGRIVLLFSFLLKKKAKYIHHFHCGNLTCKPDSSYPDLFDRSLYRFLKINSYQIAVSKRVQESYTRFVGESENLVCISNSTPFSFRQKEKTSFTIGYIGQINKLKNFHLFINCIEAISCKYPQIKFLVKGDSCNESDLSNLRIEYLPPSLDVKSFYERVDVIMFPSLASEGMPLIILEAMAFDTPVISMKIPAVRDLLGDYPLYVNHFMPEEIAAKIDWFYNQKDRSQLTQLHKNIFLKFNFFETINSITGLYDI